MIDPVEKENERYARYRASVKLRGRTWLSGEWRCKYCGYLNVPIALRCGHCGASR